MKKRLQQLKTWAALKWGRFKHWIIGVLASLGLVSVALVAPVPVSYTPATEYVDGTPLPLTDIAETRLYCNGELVATEAGADGLFEDVSSFLPIGTSSCYATHVATNTLESDPSNTVDVIVRPVIAPKPPVLEP